MNEVFELATTNARWGLAVIGLIPVILGLSIIASSLNQPRAEITDAGLRLHGEFYGRFIPTSELKLEGARTVNLAQERDMQPRLRTFGTALPGHNAGWFNLRNGEKALVYITDRSSAVYIPTSKNYAVLLTPKNPAQFLAALERLKR